MNRLKRSICILVSAVCTIASSTMPTAAVHAANAPSDRTAVISTINYTLSVAEKSYAPPKDVVSAEEAAVIGMEALNQYFPQYFEDADRNVAVKMIYNDPALEQPHIYKDGDRIRPATLPKGEPDEPAKWVGIVELLKGDTDNPDFVDFVFIFSVVPKTGALIGVERMAGDVAKKIQQYRADSKRIAEIVSLGVQLAYDKQWINGVLASADVKLYGESDGWLQETVRLTLISDTGERVRLYYRTYDKELQSIYNAAISFSVMATHF